MILVLSIMIKGNQVTLINVIGMFICLVRIFFYSHSLNKILEKYSYMSMKHNEQQIVLISEVNVEHSLKLN